MNIEVISIGTELLLGEIVDTNSAYIARQLRDIGANVYFLTTVGDNQERIVEAISRALARADVVITTGGLGPTVDDVTRQAVAAATGRELEFHSELLEQIAERFRQLGARMSENNHVQAYIPAHSIPLPNRFGTAPCFITESEQGTVISLPGVPREMKGLLAEAVLPYLRERMGGRGIIKALVLRTAGIGESQIDARITDLMKWSNPTVGLAAHTGQTDIRITARAETEAEADAMLTEAEVVVRDRVGEYIYGTGKELLEEAFIALLSKHGLTLAISYSGEDGDNLLARLQGAGADRAVLIHHEASTELAPVVERLGLVADSIVDYCDISRAEAKRLQTDIGADVIIAIVTHPEGTGITALAAHEERSRCYQYGGLENDAPVWAGTWGMSMAWRLVRHAETIL